MYQLKLSYKSLINKKSHLEELTLNTNLSNQGKQNLVERNIQNLTKTSKISPLGSKVTDCKLIKEANMGQPLHVASQSTHNINKQKEQYNTLIPFSSHLLYLPNPIINQDKDATHFYPESSTKLSTLSPSTFKTLTDTNLLNPDYDPAIDINSPYHEELLEPVYRRSSKQDSELHPILADQIDDGKFINSFLNNLIYNN